ncbi:MAG TPA: hypothetical protein VF608_01400, partial [Thermoanaerobaculia bacterium]
MTTETVVRGQGAHGVAQRTQIPIFSADDVARFSDQALARAQELLQRIESLPTDDVSAERVLDVWDDASVAMEEVFGPISLLNSVHPDKDVRDACDLALVKESSFLTDVF